MMAFASNTAISLIEDEELCPTVTDKLKNSSNPLELDFDTRDSLAHEKEVQFYVPKTDPDRSPSMQPRERVTVLKNWEGIVTSVEDASFFAAMRETESEIDRAVDEFEIDIDNVDDSDRELVSEGAVFYLTVLTRHPKGEGLQKTTRIVFRRMPRWSSRDIERAEFAATDLWEKLHPRPAAQSNKPGSKAK